MTTAMQINPRLLKLPLTPLRNDIRIFPMPEDSDGCKHWTVFDPVADSYFRIDQQDYEIISRLYPGQTIGQLLSELEAIGQQVGVETILRTHTFLQESNLLVPVPRSTAQRLERQEQLYRRSQMLSWLTGYLFFKVPLISPDTFLTHSAPWIRLIFNPLLIGALTILSLCGYLLLIPNFSRLQQAVLNSLSWGGFVRYTLAIVVVKIIHECAHAYTAKLQGIRVRKMGIAFLVFFPRLYTDVTDSWQIPQRHIRMRIDAAGILTELLIAGLAALVWVNTPNGSTVNTICYYTFSISVVNTVLLNANPLLRYDGYYLLMDALNIDNLQQVAFTYAKALFRRLFFGIPFKPDREYTGWRRCFLTLFGIATFLYRLSIYTGIILIIYFKFTKALALLLILVEIYVLLLDPLKREIQFLVAKRRSIKILNLLLFLLLLGGLVTVFIAPLPWHVRLPCEFKSCQQSILYVQQAGYLQKLALQDGQQVTRGALVLQLRNPFLENAAKRQKLELQRLLLELDQMQTQSETLGAVKIKQEQIKHMRAIVQETTRKQQLLQLRAPQSGRFCLYDDQLEKGRWLAKGQAVGEIFAPEQVIVYAYAEEATVKYFQVGGEVRVSLAGQLQELTGRISAVHRIAEDKVPHRSLLRPFGGSLAVSFRGGHPKLLQAYFRVEVQLSQPQKSGYWIGRTGKVTACYYRSIGVMVWRHLLATFYREFKF